MNSSYQATEPETESLHSKQFQTSSHFYIQRYSTKDAQMSYVCRECNASCPCYPDHGREFGCHFCDENSPSNRYGRRGDSHGTGCSQRPSRRPSTRRPSSAGQPAAEPSRCPEPRAHHYPPSSSRSQQGAPSRQPSLKRTKSQRTAHPDVEHLKSRFGELRTDNRPPHASSFRAEGFVYADKREYQSRRRAGALYDRPPCEPAQGLDGRYAYTEDPEGNLIDVGPAFDPSEYGKTSKH